MAAPSSVLLVRLDRTWNWYSTARIASISMAVPTEVLRLRIRFNFAFGKVVLLVRSSVASAYQLMFARACLHT
jgi:hypothetical protein